MEEGGRRAQTRPPLFSPAPGLGRGFGPAALSPSCHPAPPSRGKRVDEVRARGHAGAKSHVLPDACAGAS
jgi:hypothetical protein